MDDHAIREQYVVHVMNKGFERAADSFARLLGKEVQVTSTKSFLIRHQDEFSFMSEEVGNLYVLITEVVGDLYGKSYLVFNEAESDDMYRLMSKNAPHNETMKDAILKEIDNIISASVVSELSNALKVNIYGDVPVLIRMEAAALQDFISEDTDAVHPSSIILTNTTFVFDHHQEIHPQFIWKLSVRIFDKVPEDQLLTKK